MLVAAAAFGQADPRQCAATSSCSLGELRGDARAKVTGIAQPIAAYSADELPSLGPGSIPAGMAGSGRAVGLAAIAFVIPRAAWGESLGDDDHALGEVWGDSASRRARLRSSERRGALTDAAPASEDHPAAPSVRV
jgi:hypothetical protein